MCGRFFLDAGAGDVIEHYNAPPPDMFAPRYNIAPTTPVLALSDGKFELYRWGLIPSWAKDVTMGSRMFNARAETVAENHRFATLTNGVVAWYRRTASMNGGLSMGINNPIAVISTTNCFRWPESGSTGRMPRVMKFNPVRCLPPRPKLRCRNCINACRCT